MLPASGNIGCCVSNTRSKARKAAAGSCFQVESLHFSSYSVPPTHQPSSTPVLTLQHRIQQMKAPFSVCLLPFPPLLLAIVMLTDRKTRLTVQQWGQDLCPAQPDHSCAAVFYNRPTGLYKPAGCVQLLSKWTPGCSLFHIQTCIHAGMQILHLSQDGLIAYTQK